MHDAPPASALGGALPAWLKAVGERSKAFGQLLGKSEEEQRRGGYADTVREICQQPLTWRQTAAQLKGQLEALHRFVAGAAPEAVLLTGSGSSLYVGECLALGLQRGLGVPVRAVGSGELLTHPDAVPPRGKYLVVSFARSGNSPESVALLEQLIEGQPTASHLVITCNRQGKLVTRYPSHPRIQAIVLAEATNDRSLVMTSSFTNMVLAARWLTQRGQGERGEQIAAEVAGAAERVLLDHADAIASVARGGYRNALYLGSGCRFGSARESALKMLEMTGGKVTTFCETYLGLRHGPMSAVHGDTLVVSFLSSDPLARAYELDLLAELRRKQLGARKIVVGQGIPPEALSSDDVALELGPPSLADEDSPVLDVLVGQLVAMFRCLNEGLSPDSPSPGGVINRVVESFRIHRPGHGRE